ncbi:inositol oxygenase [Nematostella vectensis]|uniref:inositol oxygenase n=1 Tax=Nematostella vectensis TaxID=45351 RepID=UPI002077524C|nr:inositol oxygenase [Nematostella vectensis]
MAPPPKNQIVLTDPSQLHRPEEQYQEFNKKKKEISRKDKSKEEFRNYNINLQTDVVRETYKLMHKYQTVEFVQQKIKKWGSLSKTEMTVMEAVFMLDALVDESDPDTDLPNSAHAFQTAERIRADHPDKDWFQLVGLLHDMGKVLALWGDPQWCVVGDTFPVGCQFSNKNVFPETFEDNPDTKVPEYSSKLGMYQENCGLENIYMSWGHDEYMYRVLKGNQCKIPKEGLYMVKFHSFYPWHCAGDYNYLCNQEDMEMLPWIREFNKYDLYSKSDDVPDIDDLVPYYEHLISKYCPGKLRW